MLVHNDSSWWAKSRSGGRGKVRSSRVVTGDMKQSVLVLLSRSIDYAGIFPPAALPLEEATARYAVMLAGPERWVLGRFVCPAAQLDGVETLRAVAGSPPTVLAVLGAATDSLAELTATAERDRQRLQPLLTGAGLAVDQYEVALPPSVVEQGAVGVAEAASAVTAALAAPRRMLVALEAPVAGAPTELVREVVEGLSRANQLSPATPVCLKVRCGGVTPAAVPSVEELASVLAAARDHGVLIKATQGLHHPLRHWDRELGCPVHGFLNLLAAAVLARSHSFKPPLIAQVLADEDPAAFVFTDSGFAWRDHPASLEALAAGRRFGVTSFGSCSVDEPLHGLRAMALLE